MRVSGGALNDTLGNVERLAFADDKVAVDMGGAAGLIAGAFSMAAGEYTSVASQSEFALAQIEIERRALETLPADAIPALVTRTTVESEVDQRSSDSVTG